MTEIRAQVIISLEEREAAFKVKYIRNAIRCNERYIPTMPTREIRSRRFASKL